MSASHSRIRDAFGRYIGKVTSHSGACPDCDADLAMTEEEPGLFVATVLHDDTCPTLKEIQR